MKEQRKEITGEPKNLEEQAISLVGRDIYEKLIKGYTEKQWGRDCKELPSFIIKRLPVRLTFDNNYFNALYQGIPVGGYTKMIANLLDGIEVRLNTDYLENKAEFDALADKVVYTGPIDAYFDYSWVRWNIVLSVLKRKLWISQTSKVTLRLITPIARHRGPALLSINGLSSVRMRTVMICRRLSSAASIVASGNPAMSILPGQRCKNGLLYSEYKKLADAENKVIFGGRLGEYKYYDMDQVIAAVLDRCEMEL